MAKILFLDVEPGDQAAVRKRFPEAQFAAGNLTGDALVKACVDAPIISTFISTQFPRAVLEQLPNLKLLATRSVGFDHIDLPTCLERGIVVCNVPDYGSHVIAEHVFALLLSTMRHIPEGNTAVKAGTFDYHGLRGMALKGKTIGIVGTGKIGAKVAAISHGFGMTIVAVDQCRTPDLVSDFGVRYVTLEELLRGSDIVTLHVPATAETEHMIDAKALAIMKKDSILVNTARGSLIDSAALLAGLNLGTPGRALLDVFEHEQNFEQDQALANHPRVTATPHIAFYADDSMHAMFADCFQSISAFLADKEPEHRVRPVKVICDLPGIKK